jgi:hypothetical protein
MKSKPPPSFFNFSWPPYGHNRDSHYALSKEEGVLCPVHDIYRHSSDERSWRQLCPSLLPWWITDVGDARRYYDNMITIVTGQLRHVTIVPLRSSDSSWHTWCHYVGGCGDSPDLWGGGSRHCGGRDSCSDHSQKGSPNAWPVARWGYRATSLSPAALTSSSCCDSFFPSLCLHHTAPPASPVGHSWRCRLAAHRRNPQPPFYVRR